MKKFKLVKIGVVISLILCIFAYTPDTYAKSKKVDLSDYYGVHLKRVRKNVYKIVCDWNKQQKTTEQRTQFIIEKVKGHSTTNYVGTKFRSESKELTITPDNSQVVIDFGVNKVGSADTKGAKYKKKNTKGTVGYTTYGTKREMNASIINKATLLKLIKEASESPAHPDFDKALKEAQGHYVKKDDLTKKLYCNPNSSKYYYKNGIKQSEKYTEDNKKKNYYSNVNYFYTKGDAGKVTYTYKYSNGRKDKTVTVCKKKCTEVLKAEYGPPVASKAGQCFEYKFKVTSYVKCEAEVTDNYPKESDYKTCTPPPECFNSSLGTIRQGGPNDKYESCIKDCDGGKYSRKCSDKCYKKVYGESEKTTNTAMNDVTTSIGATQVASKKYGYNCPDKDGCYYWSGNSINWRSKSSKIGRWYGNYDPHQHYCKKCTYVPVNGIWKATNCNETCAWDTDSCSKDDYLNPKQAQADADKHAEDYEKKLKECKAAKGCTTKTSTYTIDVKYQAADQSTATTIHFPNDSDYDKLSSPDGTYNTNDKKNTTIISPKYNHVTEDTNSCYTKDAKFTWYQGEWTFPGTWMNNKNGEISYSKQNGAYWKPFENKFCLPLNAKSTNIQWWMWDQVGNSYFGDSNGDFNGRIEDKENIKGVTKNFGHYAWEIIMNCFYAIKNTETAPPNDSKCTKDCCGTDCPKSCTGECCNKPCGQETNPITNSEFRIVDTNKMFGDRKENDVGFNWTAASSFKNLDIEAMISAIQGKEVYTDAKLDFRVKLTKEKLAKIRDYTKNTKDRNYTNYKGNFAQQPVGDTGIYQHIYRYSSPLITHYSTYFDMSYGKTKTLNRSADINRYVK
ncbi:MAG: hypothetical protein IKG58_04115 [Bacilli bacterium]|nr:hypothetical protein [Bacilli bacterium]MBR3049721.1 hypothetical protein [Bacilli bacterium]